MGDHFSVLFNDSRLLFDIIYISNRYNLCFMFRRKSPFFLHLGEKLSVRISIYSSEYYIFEISGNSEKSTRFRQSWTNDLAFLTTIFSTLVTGIRHDTLGIRSSVANTKNLTSDSWIPRRIPFRANFAYKRAPKSNGNRSFRCVNWPDRLRFLASPMFVGRVHFFKRSRNIYSSKRHREHPGIRDIKKYREKLVKEPWLTDDLSLSCSDICIIPL